MNAKTFGAGLVLFVTTLVCGVLISRNSWNGYVYVYVPDQRSPSAIPRRHDLTRFAGQELTKRIHERLIGDARILHRESDLGIELGQFVTENSDRKKVFACSVYDKIEMRFVAEGIATGGNLPVMEVMGNCEINSEQVNWIKPIWIPAGRLIKEPAINKEISFFDAEPVSLKFSHMSDQWPSQWVLDSVRLVSSNGVAEDVQLSRDRIRLALPRSLILEWEAQK